VRTVGHEGKHIRVVSSGQLVNTIILTLAQNGIEALDVQMEKATLEDAFVKLTGRHIHENKKDPSR
jgi:ABC-2 type transport system ATP-binding protein